MLNWRIQQWTQVTLVHKLKEKNQFGSVCVYLHRLNCVFFSYSVVGTCPQTFGQTGWDGRINLKIERVWFNVGNEVFFKVDFRENLPKYTTQKCQPANASRKHPNANKWSYKTLQYAAVCSVKASVTHCVLSRRDEPRRAQVEKTSCSIHLEHCGYSELETTKAELTITPFPICLTSHLLDCTCLFLPLTAKKSGNDDSRLIPRWIPPTLPQVVVSEFAFDSCFSRCRMVCLAELKTRKRMSQITCRPHSMLAVAVWGLTHLNSDAG